MERRSTDFPRQEGGRKLNDRGLASIGVGAVQALTETPVPTPSNTANMPTPEDQLKPTKLRLQIQLDNIAFAPTNATLSEEQRAILKAQFASVQKELLLLTGAIALN